MAKPPVCSVCRESRSGMLLMPVPDYRGEREEGEALPQDYWCPVCLKERIAALEEMVTMLKGGPLIRAIENATSLRFSVTQAAWYVANPDDPEDVLPAVPPRNERSMQKGLEVALTMLLDFYKNNAEQSFLVKVGKEAELVGPCKPLDPAELRAAQVAYEAEHLYPDGAG